MLYRAKKLINWCPRCRTALSDLEVEHDDVKGSLWHIAYPIKGRDASLVVATTRPETMLGDTAVAVHPDDPRYQAFVGQKVLLPLTNREIPIIADGTLVDMAFGSGAVKVTPAHDFNDYETGLRHGLEMISVLDESGKIDATEGHTRAWTASRRERRFCGRSGRRGSPDQDRGPRAEARQVSALRDRGRADALVSVVREGEADGR